MTEQKRPVRRGLSEQEAERSTRVHGKNIFTKQKRDGFWHKFGCNLGDPVIKVLLLALVVNLLLSFKNADWFETAGIAFSIFLATLISTLSEYGSEAAFSRLQERCGAALCRVRRGGTVREIPFSEVAVGDIVLLAAGDAIPADGVLFEGTLSVDQSALTGESREVEKYPVLGDSLIRTPSAPDGLFAGCTVCSGAGEMEILAIGDATVLGGISGEVQQETRESPLKRRLTRLARQISIVGYAAALCCVAAFLFHKLVIDAHFSGAEIIFRLTTLPYMLDILLSALTLGLTVVVVAVPEGLPMMIAVVLSANMRRMVRDQVLVRKPAGIEAAGCMNILFTDKTGTLTAGKLTISGILTVEATHGSAKSLSKAAPQLFRRFLLSAHANSGAVVGEREGVPLALGGNATDRALLSSFLSFSTPRYEVTESIPFDSAQKFAAVRLTDGCVFVTGAPEKLLPYVKNARNEQGKVCPCSTTAFFARVRERTARGERVILLCEADTLPHGRQGRLNCSLTLLGAVSFCDPLRPEASKAVETLHHAGVQVVMITGDGKETAAAIAAACGILRKNDLALDRTELERFSDEELRALLPRLRVVARALPSDKSRLVRVSEEAGLVVGMTGDGINDAPALKRADVGFAMGSGTSVAKEAGDIVILDDNLSSVVKAVLYGRTVFKSIRKFITLQLVMNFCAVGISVIGPFIGFDAPVTVVQMLWINLIMDTLGGLAFAGEAPSRLDLHAPPNPPDEPILTRDIAGRITFMTAFTVALSVFFLKCPLITRVFAGKEGNLKLLSAFFALFIFAGVFNCFNARTDRVRMFAGIGRNRAFLPIMLAVASVQVAFIYLGGSLLRTVPLTPRELLLTLALALSVIPAGLLQLVHRRLSGKSRLY